jgi:hypothetical protein
MRPCHRLAALICFLMVASCVWSQQAPPAALPATQTSANADFLKEADEVLADMSKLLSLPIRRPLKRSVRTRAEIRQYLVQNMQEQRDSQKMHADVRALELLGLLPKGYPLEQKLIDLLTQQIAGVYDSKEREFFILASTAPAEQRVIMAHELTHALEDQSFHVQQWTEAVKNNDDAQLARDAFLEGSATVAMIDYLLRDSGVSFRSLGNVDPSLLLGDVDNSKELADVPLVLKDQLIFPYLAGAAFSVKALDAAGGWKGLKSVFDNPPASTQQIMHPELYLRGVKPETVLLPPLNRVVPRGWKKLDENVMGEFGMNQVFKQFLGKTRADELAATWAGDRYAIYEESPQGRALLVIRLRVAKEAQAAQLVAGYRELLEKKYPDQASATRQANSLFVDAADGGAFVRCVGRDCLVGEGATRAQFDALGRAMNWPAAGAIAARAPRRSERFESASLAIPRVPPLKPLSQGLAAR